MKKGLTFDIAINGFGRIGRAFARLVLADANAPFRLVAINTHGSVADIRDGLVYDSVYGTFSQETSVKGSTLVVGTGKDRRDILTFNQDDPKKLPWRRLGVDLVVDSTGQFMEVAKARAHLKAGAKQVLISAWPKGTGAEIVMTGVRPLRKPTAQVLTHASCTTSAVAPLIEIIRRELPVEDWTMFGVQSVTHSQSTVDRTRGDGRKRRAAIGNIIPIHLDAELAVPKIFPSISKKFIGQGVRVPTLIVHFGLLTVSTRRPFTAAQVNKILQNAAQGPWQGLVEFTKEPIVSQDVKQNEAAAVIDGSMTQVTGRLVQIGFWYDNEWAFAARLRDLISEIAHARLDS